MEEHKTLGMLIHKFRKARKMSLSEFSKCSGLSKAYLSILEKNERPDTKKPPLPSLKAILAAATAMERDPTDVLEELGIDIKDKTREIEAQLLGPLSTTRPGTSGELTPWEYIPLTIENLRPAISEGRLLILPFRAPVMGALVYVPLKQLDDMPVAHTVVNCKGGIYTATCEAGGPITFSLFDIGHVVFMTRKEAREAKERWRAMGLR